MDATLPAWLAPEKPTLPYYHPEVVKSSMSLAATKRAIEEHTFEALFEPSLEHISSGKALNLLLESDPRKPNLGRFIRWVYRDPERQQQYREAQRIGAEVVSQEIIEIADGTGPEEDSRSKLRIDTRKWLLGVWDRDRFGDVKKIDQTISVDLGGAMERAQERLQSMRTVDVASRVIGGE
jgi:hypothetical protein